MTLGKPLEEAYHEIQVAIGRINNDTIRLRRLRDHLTKHHTRLVALFGGQFSGPNTSVCEAGFAIVRFPWPTPRRKKKPRRFSEDDPVPKTLRKRGLRNPAMALFGLFKIGVPNIVLFGTLSPACLSAPSITSGSAPARWRC